VIRREDGRVLLLRRAPGVATDAGRWELPGGKMAYGETLEDALAREVEEETGIAVRVGQPVHVTHFVKDPFWVTCVTFVCDYDGGDVRLSEENDAFDWIELSAIAGRDYARTIEEQLRAYAAYEERE
jgi:8-oxo-dGTP diphosphatase